MATSGRPVLSQGIHTYMRDGNRTNKRHARYGQLYLNSQIIGGVQMFNYRETNGTHLEPEGGSDYNEIVVGQRQFSVTLRRQMVRGSDLAEMVRNEFPDVQDVDFRDLPFVLRYHYLYTSATNKTKYEDATFSH